MTTLGEQTTMSGISVQLVDAVTKQPFKEHNKEGVVCVEAEPDAEYFIVLKKKKSHAQSFYLRAVVFVDGICLGTLAGSLKKPWLIGSRSRFNDGVMTTTALRFGAITVSDAGGAKPVDISRGLVGTVTVDIYEAFDSGARSVIGNYVSEPGLSLDVEAQAPPATGGAKNKIVRTKVGNFSEMRYSTTGLSRHYVTGRRLETITLRYATALGLVHVGVLPKPPFWDHARLLAPATIQVDPDLAGIKPTIVKDAAMEALGVKGKQYECFDLSHLE